MHPKNVGSFLMLCFAIGAGGCKPAEQPAKRTDLGSSARYVCKDFLTRSGYRVQDWGEWWTWTTVHNADGTWSVGARFMGAAPGGVTRNLYVSCVMTNSGDDWRLQALSRIQ